MTASEFSVFVNGEGRQFVDREISKALDTYRRKKPAADDVVSRLQEIEGALRKKDLELRRKDLSFFAYKTASEKGIPFDLLDGFPLQDEQRIAEKIDQLAQAVAVKKRGDIQVDYFVNECKPSPSMPPAEEPRTFGDYLRMFSKRRGS